jgi:hypothetical protein
MARSTSYHCINMRFLHIGPEFLALSIACTQTGTSWTRDFVDPGPRGPGTTCTRDLVTMNLLTLHRTVHDLKLHRDSAWYLDRTLVGNGALIPRTVINNGARQIIQISNVASVPIALQRGDEKKKKKKHDQAVAEARSGEVVEETDHVGAENNKKKKKKKKKKHDQVVDVVVQKKEEEQRAEVAAAAAGGDRVPSPQPAAKQVAIEPKKAVVVVEEELEEDRQRPNEPYIKWRISVNYSLWISIRIIDYWHQEGAREH